MKIGRKLKGGEVIELVGDLGSGKTSFVRGLVEGAGSDDAVRSPSFTLANQYRAPRFTLHHFDFYRLDEPGIIKRELSEVFQDSKAVSAIEWADPVKSILPAERLTVHILATGDEERRLDLTYPESLSYLLPD